MTAHRSPRLANYGRDNEYLMKAFHCVVKHVYLAKDGKAPHPGGKGAPAHVYPLLVSGSDQSFVRPRAVVSAFPQGILLTHSFVPTGVTDSVPIAKDSRGFLISCGGNGANLCVVNESVGFLEVVNCRVQTRHRCESVGYPCLG
jgi:hypothetical protein